MSLNRVRTPCRAFVIIAAALTCGCEYASDATVLFRGPSDAAAELSSREGAVANDAPEGGGSVSAARLTLLSRGLEVQEWMGVQYNRYWLSPAELATLQSQGVRHLRIPFAMSLLFDENAPGVLKAGGLANYDEILDQVLGAGLAVVVHPAQTDARTWTDAAYANKLESFWRALASHLSTRASDRVFLKVEIDPDAPRADDWYAVQGRLLGAARDADANRTLLVTPNAYTRSGDRSPLEAVKESLTSLTNVAYDFGFFAPITFTHQGADWRPNEPWLTSLHDLPYPSSEAACAPFLNAIDAPGRAAAQTYCADHYDQAALAALIAPVAQWARDNHVTVINGGFGVYKPKVDAASRAQWISDVRSVLEAAGIPWACYTDASGFAALVTTNGRRGLEPAVLSALGLMPAP